MDVSITIKKDTEFLKTEFVSSGSFTVPVGVSELIVYGSGGGANGAGGGAGGSGCLIQNATISVTAGQVLTVTIGGAGSDSLIGSLTFRPIATTSGGAILAAGSPSLYASGGAGGASGFNGVGGGGGGGASWGSGGAGGAGGANGGAGAGGSPGGYGAGGGGGGLGTNGGANGAGGAGGGGRIVVLYAKTTTVF